METTRLANFFNKQREIIEAAELPFAKMAVFILPILAPFVPAFITGLHTYQLLLEIFTFQGAEILASILAFVVGVVLEMLGYVGAISFIKSLFDWVRSRRDEYILPFVLNGLAYVFYLAAMYLINVQLGQYFGTPAIVNKIFGLLSFITVPTGLLAANHLSAKEVKEEDTVLRHEKMEHSLKRTALKKGINIFAPTAVYEQTVAQTKERREKNASDYKEEMIEWMSRYYQRYGKSPRVVEVWRGVLEKREISYNNSKGFVSTTRTNWMSQNGISGQ